MLSNIGRILYSSFFEIFASVKWKGTDT